MSTHDIWLTFAFIYKNKVVNLACYLYTGYTEASEHARSYAHDWLGAGDPKYENGAVAVEVTQIPVQIGDDYIDGIFYRDGEEIRPLLSIEETVNITQDTLTALELAVIDMYEKDN